MLIVENGEGLENANAYVDVAFVSEYATQFGVSEWADNVSKQQVAIINATRFIDLRYGRKIPVKPLNDSQSLVFPKQPFIDKQGRKVEGVPTNVKRATVEAALMFIKDGTLDFNANSGNSIKSESFGAGSGAISESITYFYPKEENTFYTVDAFMHDYIQSSGLNIPRVRG